MVKLLPITSESSQKWLKIPEQFSADMADVVFDLGVVTISWFKRLDPAAFDDACTVVNLTKLQGILGHGSDLTHVLAFPGRINGVLKAENSFELIKSSLRLSRTVASIAKILFDHAVIISPKGQFIAGRVKYVTWAFSGAITVGERLYAFYDPSEEEKLNGKGLLMLDLVKSTAFLALGILRLLDKPELRRYVLPLSTILLILASVTFTGKKMIKAQSDNA